MSELIEQSLNEGGVLTLTLHDEKRRNALSEQMLEDLGRLIKQAGANVGVRVVVLKAVGSAFSAGHDLKELTVARSNSDGGKAYFTKIMDMCAGVMQSVVNCPKPIIAQVDGVATAAGCQLVASCDLAVASDASRFSTPGVNIGLFCSTPMVALSRNISNKHAMEMLLTGDMISAHRAAQIGLINDAVPQDDLEQTVMKMAKKIASKSSHTVKIGKTAFYQQSEMPLADAYQFAANVMVENMMTNDANEGISAFIEKRTPKWKDS